MNWEKIGETSRNFKAQPSKEGWNRVQIRLQNKQKPIILMSTWLKVAAAALLVLGIAGTLYWNQSVPTEAESTFTLEALNSEEVDQVAVMALDFTKYIESHHPELVLYPKQ